MNAIGQGFKSLFTGAVDVPAQINATVTLPDVPTTLLDLIPRVPLRGGNTFEYLRQTVKDNNAGRAGPGARADEHLHLCPDGGPPP